MAFWNRGKKSETVGSGESQENAWTQAGMEQVPFAGAERDKTEAERNALRQQNKIVAVLMTGNINLVTQDVPPKPRDRDLLIDRLADGRVGEAEERWLLGSLMDPISKRGSSGVFMNYMATDKHQRRILGAMTSVGFNHYSEAGPAAIDEFIQKYPLPMDFEQASTGFLEAVKESNSAEKLAEYEQAMEQFKHVVYGKRQEYWEQMKVLNAEAEERRAGWTQFVVMPKTPTIERGPRQSAERITPEITTIGEAEQREILRRTEIDGDPWEQDGNLYQANVEVFEQAGLAPEHKIKLDNVEINLSKIYNAGSHQAVMAYVKMEDGIKARSYYRSHSAGVWRYLPDYVSTPDGVVEYYGKGRYEESVTLPVEIQMGLAEIERQQQRAMEITTTSADFLMCATAKRYNSKDEIRYGLRNNQMRGDYYQEVSQVPSIELEARQKRNYKIPPEELDIRGSLAPVFDESLAEYQIDTALYGNVENEIYRSKDGTVRYVMCRDKKGEAWMSGAETNGPITSTGLRASWVQLGDIGTSPYDYEVQSAGYGDTSDRSPMNPKYVDMWKNYVSKIPVIRRYLQERQ